jgi:hypothetical protein
MGSIIGFIVELAVIVLLGFTVVYCIRLDRRLERLRADERSMRQTVVDLGISTERAERTIEGLKLVLAECDRTLGDRLRRAADASEQLDAAVRSGGDVLDRIGKIVGAAQEATDETARLAEPVLPTNYNVINLSETAAAAEAFADMARRRIKDAA